MLLNSEIFNFQFFLGGRTKVDNLEEASRKYGGATKFDDGCYSNIPTDNLIKINNEKNNISVFVPSTMDVSNVIDNSIYIEETINSIRKKYPLESLKFYNTTGGWLDEKNNSVVIEGITIITVELNTIKIKDIAFFINIAQKIKADMKQQGVSIGINEALAII